MLAAACLPASLLQPPALAAFIYYPSLNGFSSIPSPPHCPSLSTLYLHRKFLSGSRRRPPSAQLSERIVHWTLPAGGVTSTSRRGRGPRWWWCCLRGRLHQVAPSLLAPTPKDPPPRRPRRANEEGGLAKGEEPEEGAAAVARSLPSRKRAGLQQSLPAVYFPSQCVKAGSPSQPAPNICSHELSLERRGVYAARRPGKKTK